jgi:hypothetical protein
MNASHTVATFRGRIFFFLKFRWAQVRARTSPGLCHLATNWPLDLAQAPHGSCIHWFQNYSGLCSIAGWVSVLGQGRASKRYLRCCVRVVTCDVRWNSWWTWQPNWQLFGSNLYVLWWDSPWPWKSPCRSFQVADGEVDPQVRMIHASFPLSASWVSRPWDRAWLDRKWDSTPSHPCRWFTINLFKLAMFINGRRE